MSDLIEPELMSQLPVATLPLLSTDYIVISRDGTNLLQSTIGALNIPSGGLVPELQTLTSAEATAGITISEGINVVRINPAISADSTFAITGGAFGDSLTLFVPQNATGGWDLILDGVDYGNGVALTQITIELKHDGTNWNLVNSPLWN
jgi:hypothetical protein